MPRTPPAVRTLVALVAALAACTRSPANQGNSETSLGPPPPRVVRKIVTLAPSLTEIVLALGAGDRITGVTRFDEAPEVAKAARVGGYSDPSAETILKLAPDVVLCQPSPGNRGAVQVVADNGISVRVFPLETIADTTRAITAIGAILDRADAATALVASIDSARTRARAAAAKRAKAPRVALLVGIDPLVAAGPGSFSHELLVDAGAIDIVEASSQPWPRLSPERLIAQAPDLLLLAGVGQHGAGLAGLPPEVADRAIVLKSLGFLRPGPLLVEALDELTAHLDAAGAPR